MSSDTSDKEKQIDELCSLESIYNPKELTIGQSSGIFNAFIEIPTELRVVYKDLRASDTRIQELRVKYLPHMVLKFMLPHDYPSKHPPKFSLMCNWLHKEQISQLCNELDNMWEANKGVEILFQWTQFLKEESLRFLNVSDKIDITRLHMQHVYFMDQSKRRLMEKEEFKLDESQSCVNVVSVEKSSIDDVTKKTQYLRDDGVGECLKLDNVTESKKVDNISAGAGVGGSGRWCQNNCSEASAVRPVSEQDVDRSHSPQPAKDERAMSLLHPGISIVRLIKEFNEERENKEFCRNLYSCKICFQDKLGRHCMKFEKCGHVFCKECISSYLEVRIRDGSVQNIGCPEDKCTSEALPYQVKELVSVELFTRYDSVLLNAMLGTMPDIIHCPRTWCQYPVTKEPNEKMATCPSCDYVFCIYCKMVYHGIEPCRFKSVEKRKLVDEYQNGSADQKRMLEQRYGRKQLQTLVDTTMSELWIDNNSKTCPHCNAAIEKSDGCNKMICWRCGTCFCWICSEQLNSNPYHHFNNPTSKCHQLLFLGVPLEEEDLDFGGELGNLVWEQQGFFVR